MATEHFSLLEKRPELFGDNNNFMALGILGCRGDKFLVFLDLQTGKTYIEETFATTAMGDFVVGLNQIENDELWKKCTAAAQMYGLTAVKHIAKCVDQLGIRLSPQALAMLAGTQHKILGDGV